MKTKLLLFFSGLMLISNCMAQQGEPLKLLYREDWNELPPFEVMTPYSLTQKDVQNSDLIQTLYGPAQDSLKKRHHGTATDAYYVYSGFCRSNWALALSNKKCYVDLRGDAVIRCRVRNSGYRDLHLIIQMDSGNWFVSDQVAGPSSLWQEHDFVIKDIKWSLLNINTVTPAGIVDDPVQHYGANWLRQIDKIGFTDLMNGGLSSACSRVDWIEVYADSIKK
jgi:hypothetical protein